MNQNTNIISPNDLYIPRNLKEVISQIENSVCKSIIFCSDISSHHEGAAGIMKDVVISVPAFFKENQRNNTIKAGELAEFSQDNN